MAKSFESNVTKQVDAIIKVEKAGLGTSSNAFIAAFRSLAPLVANADKADRAKLAKDIGTVFATDYDDKQRALHGKPERNGPMNAAYTTGCAAVLRCARNAWWPTMFDMFEEMNKRVPLTYTMIRKLGGRCSVRSDAPTLSWLETQRAEINAKANGTGDNKGKSRKRSIDASARINKMLDAVDKLPQWIGQLPKAAQPHMNRIVSELMTLTDMWNEAVAKEEKETAE